MAKGEYLGEFEYVVLLALMRVGADAYGASIRREIEASTLRSPSIGALHATLERLERKGLVRSRIGEATAERGGRAKRHFEIEPTGVAALRETRAMLKRLETGLALEARSS